MNETSDVYISEPLESWRTARAKNEKHLNYWIDRVPLKDIKRTLGMEPKKNGPWIAGGSAMALANPDHNYLDIDFFFSGAEQVSSTLSTILNHLADNGTVQGMYPMFVSVGNNSKRILFKIAEQRNQDVEEFYDSQVIEAIFGNPNNVSPIFLDIAQNHCRYGKSLRISWRLPGGFVATATRQNKDLLNFTIDKLSSRSFKSLEKTKGYDPSFYDIIKTTKVQLVLFGTAPSLPGILSRFDFTVCQVGFDGENLVFGPATIWDLAKKNLRVLFDYNNPENYSRIKRTLLRIKKYSLKSFEVDQNVVKELQEIWAVYSVSPEYNKKEDNFLDSFIP